MARNFIPQKSIGTTTPSQPSQRNMVNLWPSTKKKHLLLVGWWFCMAKIQRISFYASSRWLCKRPSLIMKKNIFLVYICLYHQYISMIFPWTSTSTHPFGWCWGWKRSQQHMPTRSAAHCNTPRPASSDAPKPPPRPPQGED
jgi:hypothetical protein